MFVLLFIFVFILAMVCVFKGWFSLSIILSIALIFIAIAGGILQTKRKGNAVGYDEVLDESSTPKIGAAVSNTFYNEVKVYCQKHNITISDLIRKSVQNYMNQNR